MIFSIILFINPFTKEVVAQDRFELAKVCVNILADADRQFAAKDTIAAIQLLEKVIALNDEPSPLYLPGTINSSLFRTVHQSSFHADLCLIIANLSIQLKEEKRAHHYLMLANTTFLPRYGCFNGVLMYKTKLAIHFAEYYLLINEEEKAIVQLLENFMNNESYDMKATILLNSILLKSYTQKDIQDEIERGLQSMVYVNQAEGYSDVVQMTFFDHSINRYAYGDLEDVRKIFRNNRCVKFLCKN